MNQEKISENIKDIIRDLSNSESKLEDILRKTYVFSFQIENQNLKNWVYDELNGYKDYASLPEYRMMISEVYGILVYKNGYQNIERIPVELLESKLRGTLKTLPIFKSIAEIEALIEEKAKENLRVSVNFHIRKRIQKMITNCCLFDAYQVISIHSLISIISNLKNQLLKFLLELNQEIGTNKELSIMNKQDKVNELFDKTIGNISGTNINISVGENNLQSTTNDNAKTIITQGINNSYTDNDLVKDLKDLLEIFRKLEANEDIEMEDTDEIKSELNRIEIQSNKEKPKRNIVKQSLDILQTMAINITSNVATEPVVDKINMIIKLLGDKM